MYIMNRHFNNRGVSQVIAALLLIAIAVAAAILLYVFAIGLLGSLGSSGGQQTKQQLIMEAYRWDTSGGIPGKLSVTLRNVGSASINLASTDLFVNGNLQAAFLASCPSALTPGGSCTVTGTTLTGSGYISGAAYPLKLVTPDGGVFSYSIICGSAS